MKSRLLRKLLDNTEYIICLSKNNICIGSRFIPELITININTLKIESTYSFKDERLEIIWNKLNDIINSGDILNIINGNDSIENMFPVYSVKNGKLIEQYTDIFGWPNSTHDGELMYENSHFLAKEEALDCGIKEIKRRICYIKERIEISEEELKERKDFLSKICFEFDNLLKIKKNIS
jgi:hypothetical protein